MDTPCLALEYEKTRLSLKDAFEELFAKYGRDFDDGDEIDIMNLRVVKPGGFLARTSVIKFGNRYKRSKRAPSGDESIGSSDTPSEGSLDETGDGDDADEMDEHVFERVCSRIKKSQAMSRLHSKGAVYDFAVHFGPQSVLCEPIKADYRGQHHFDSLLFVLLKEEIKRDEEARGGLVDQDKRLCRCGRCFDCLLLLQLAAQ